jgi:gephyrin
VKALLTKEASGLTQAMLQGSLKSTPMGALARPVCGLTSSNCIVVTVPGSPKGAKENLEALLPILPHALKLASGESSRQLHAKEPPAQQPEPSTSHSSHAHSHGHHPAPKPRTHDPARGATARHRSSPYPIIPMSAALDLIFKHSPTMPVQGFEPARCHGQSAGYILAEDVHATFDIPSSNTTNVDGYAVRSSDGKGDYPVLTVSSGLMARNEELPAGRIHRVNTGGPIPDGADAIVMVEDTEIVSKTSDGKEEAVVRILAKVDAGENVRKPGSDVRKGDLVLQKGQLLSGTGGEIGTLCFVGRTAVRAAASATTLTWESGASLRATDSRDSVYGQRDHIRFGESA